MAPNKLNGPNFRTRNYVTPDVGKSRTAFWEAEATIPQKHPVHLEFVRGTAQFTLPANSRVVDEVVVFNNSSIAVDVAVGYTSGGATIANPASAAANSTVRAPVLDTSDITRADRTVFVTAAAWPTEAQGDAHVVLYVQDYPPVPDATAIS